MVKAVDLEFEAKASHPHSSSSYLFYKAFQQKPDTCTSLATASKTYFVHPVHSPFTFLFVVVVFTHLL